MTGTVDTPTRTASGHAREGRTRRPTRRIAASVPRTVLWLVVAAGGLAFVAVLVYAVLSALKPASQIFSVPVRWLPDPFTWRNFALPFTQTAFARYYLNSAVVGVSVTVLNVVTCTLAGYSFAKFSYPGRNAAFVVVLATAMVPLEVIYVPLYALVYQLGWVNSFAGLIVPAGTNAFGIFLMRQAISQVPDELLEAARIDGAGELRTLMRVIAPLTRGPMAALALFIFMTNWDSHLWPLLVGADDAHTTLPVGLAAMQANNMGAAGVPMMMAAAVLALLPTVLLFLSLQRRFVQGVAMTAGIR